MKDLIVAATKREILPFLQHIQAGDLLEEGKIFETQGFDLIVTGVGMLATAYKLGEILNRSQYKLILNFGIAGSFRDDIAVESLVCVGEESVADFGAESSQGGYLDIFEMGLLDPNHRPFADKKLMMNPAKYPELTSSYREVRSLSVNRVLAHTDSIEWVKEKFDPDIVNMEGAAVFYASLQHSIDCIQIRSISDHVEKSARGSWKIAEAIAALNQEIIKIYEARYNIP